MFIDDEIWEDNTLKATLSVLDILNTQIGGCTVIAEDGGFKHEKISSPFNVGYIAPKTRLPVLYNAVSHIIPNSYASLVKAGVENGENLNDKQIMCTLLDLPVKTWNDGNPIFTDALLERAHANILGFSIHQDEFRQWLNELVHKSLVDE